MRPEGLTLRQLWSMAQGRLQMQRALVIAQAGVLFFEGREDDLVQFIRTGSLEGKPQVMPCSTVVLEAMQRAEEERRKRYGR